MVGALGKRRLCPRTRLQPKLVRNRVLLQNVRDAFYLTDRSGEERDTITGLNQIACFGYCNRHVALECQRRASRYVKVIRGFLLSGDQQVQLLESNLCATRELGSQSIPLQEV